MTFELSSDYPLFTCSWNYHPVVEDGDVKHLSFPPDDDYIFMRDDDDLTSGRRHYWNSVAHDSLRLVFDIYPVALYLCFSSMSLIYIYEIILI